MMRVTRGDRVVHAMAMNEAYDRCLGVVQCGLQGCEGYMALVEGKGKPSAQVAWFLKNHECRSPLLKKTKRS